MPRIVDGDAVVFDSNAILLYLAANTGRFLGGGGAGPARTDQRGALPSWVMFVIAGIGPVSGQVAHLRHVTRSPRTRR